MSSITNFGPLKAKLLCYGGTSVCCPDYDEDLPKIMERGVLMQGLPSKLMVGEPNQCHANACNLYESNLAAGIDVRIWTGYAISSDGIWRQHSWLKHYYTSRNGRKLEELVETTKRRLLYFGFELTPEEADEFCYNNYY